MYKAFSDPVIVKAFGMTVEEGSAKLQEFESRMSKIVLSTDSSEDKTKKLNEIIKEFSLLLSKATETTGKASDALKKIWWKC